MLKNLLSFAYHTVVLSTCFAAIEEQTGYRIRSDLIDHTLFRSSLSTFMSIGHEVIKKGGDIMKVYPEYFEKRLNK